jgi:transcriptional regulator with XRE-family HTH domain
VKNLTLKRLLDNLKELRNRKRLTQEAFAEHAGMSYKYYQAVETGKKPELRLSTLERLAKAHGLEPHELLSPKLPRHKSRPRKKT